MFDISVIIVSWNACGYLRDCLSSIRANPSPVVGEIIVVDNASTDGSPDMVEGQFPEVILIRLQENLGFAGANNVGIAHARGSLVALVNSDAVVHSGCFDRLAAAFESSAELGLVGPKVLGRDGRLQLTCGRFPTIWNTACEFSLLRRFSSRCPLLAGFQMQPEDHSDEREVEVLSGCFWVARREVFDEIGGLDARFFFYAEDVDWCKRCKDAGWKIIFIPEATVTHFGGGSSSNDPLRFGIEMLRANLIYWRKYHGTFGGFAFCLLAFCQHCFRLAIRGGLKLIGGGNRDQDSRKLREHLACIRWLLTGRGV